MNVDPTEDQVAQAAVETEAKKAFLGVGLIKFAAREKDKAQIEWNFGRFVMRDLNTPAVNTMVNAFVEGHCLSRTNPVRILVKNAEIRNADSLLKETYSGLEAQVPEVEFSPGVQQVIVMAGHHRYVAANRAFPVIIKEVVETRAQLAEVEAKLEAAQGVIEELRSQAVIEQLEEEVLQLKETLEFAMRKAHLVQMWPAEVYSWGWSSF